MLIELISFQSVKTPWLPHSYRLSLWYLKRLVYSVAAPGEKCLHSLWITENHRIGKKDTTWWSKISPVSLLRYEPVFLRYLLLLTGLAFFYQLGHNQYYGHVASVNESPQSQWNNLPISASDITFSALAGLTLSTHTALIPIHLSSCDISIAPSWIRFDRLTIVYSDNVACIHEPHFSFFSFASQLALSTLRIPAAVSATVFHKNLLPLLYCFLEVHRRKQEVWPKSPHPAAAYCGLYILSKPVNFIFPLVWHF